MKKKYCTRRLPFACVPLFAALPLAGAAFGGSLDAGSAAASASSFVLASCLYWYARRIVARIEGGRLSLLSGIGLAEEGQLELSSIVAVERPRPWFMTIRYGEGKSIGFETDKSVLNELSKDLAIFVGKKAGSPAPRA